MPSLLQQTIKEKPQSERVKESERWKEGARERGRETGSEIKRG